MRRHGQTSGEPSLFDLPLVVDPGLKSEVDRLAGEDEAEVEASEPSTEPSVEGEQIELPAGAEALAEESSSSSTTPSLLRRRLQAGILDGAVAAGALALLFYGAAELGAPARPADGPAYLLVMLEFTFLYSVFSIAFWGRTPGMLRAGLTATPASGAPLGLGRAMLRWLGGVVTLSLLGLPALLALRDGRSLTDLLSGSPTRVG